MDDAHAASSPVDELTAMFSNLLRSGLISRADLIAAGHTDVATRIMVGSSAGRPSGTETMRRRRPRSRDKREHDGSDSPIPGVDRDAGSHDDDSALSPEASHPPPPATPAALAGEVDRQARPRARLEGVVPGDTHDADGCTRGAASSGAAVSSLTRLMLFTDVDVARAASIGHLLTALDDKPCHGLSSDREGDDDHLLPFEE
jgi:hypothetical protein